MPYNAALDGIRAIAALLIVAYHARIPGMPGGFFGVDVFFVLSGYLVTRLLVEHHERHGAIRYRVFMARRLRRLAPALLVLLAVYVLAAPWAFPEVPFVRHARDAFWSVLYLLNYASVFGEPTAILGNIWSLGVEMQFYLIWPFVLVSVLKLPRPAALMAVAALFALATVWRWMSVEYLGDIWAFYVRTDAHASGLLLGCLVGLVNPSVPSRRMGAYLGLLAILLLVFAFTFFSTRWLPTVYYGFTLVEFASALLIIARPVWLGGAVLAWLGQMSYGLYLWHYPIMRYLRTLEWEWSAVLVVGGGLGLLCAVLSHYLVERRFYRRRVEKNGAGEPGLVSARLG